MSPLFMSFELALTLFLSIWNGLLFVMLVVKLLKTKTEERYFSKKIVSSALLNFGGFSICYMIHSIVRMHNFGDWSIRIMYIVFTVTFSISFASSYMFVVSMIYASFNGSQFAIKKWNLYLHLLLALILFMLCSFGTLFIYVLPNKWGPILHSILYLLYIIGLCSMYYLLNMNLIKMVMLGNDRSRIYIFNPIQSGFMSTITRLSVLQGIFTFTAIFYLLITILNNAVFKTPLSNKIEWLCYAFTIIIGTLSIYLTFNMNINEYKCICKACNIFCKICCESLVKWLYRTNAMKTEIKHIRKKVITSTTTTTTTITTCTSASTETELELTTPKIPAVNNNEYPDPAIIETPETPLFYFRF